MNHESTLWLSQRWRDYWFQPAAPTQLALCRILFFLGMLYIYPHPTLSNPDLQFLPQWGDVPSYFFQPIHLFKWFSLPIFSYDTLVVLETLFMAALLCACVGLGSRVSMFVAFVLGLYLWGMPQNFGKIYHTESIPVFIIGILACSRCGDALSVDAWIRRRLHGENSSHAAVSHGEYTWPIRLIWVLFAISFFAAGLSKVAIGGWAWLVSDQMKWNIVAHHVQEAQISTLGITVARIDLLSQALTWYAVAAELAAPLLLLGPRWRIVIGFQLLMTQAGIWVLMGVPFSLWLVCYLFFISWDRVLALRLPFSVSDWVKFASRQIPGG